MEQENFAFATHSELMTDAIVSVLGCEKAPKFYFDKRDKSFWLSGKFDMLDIIKLKGLFIELSMPNVTVVNQTIMNVYRKEDKDSNLVNIYEGDEVRTLKG